MKMLRSPSHVMFVASNVALLVHLLFYSTVVRKLRMEEFMSHMNDLENYEDLIRDLDQQNEEVQKQITILKQLQQKDLDHFDSNQHQLEPSKRTQSTTALNENRHLHHSHANNFLKQRKFFASTFNEKGAIAKLFQCNSSSQSDDSSFKGSLGSPTFSDPILNPLMALSHQFIKAFLVEMNLRTSFGDKDCQRRIARDSFLLHDDLFAYMNHDSDKEELLAKLFAMRKDFRCKSNSELLLQQLDSTASDNLFDDFGQSEDFKIRGSRRYDIFQHVSGRWLNYEHSDTFNSVQALSPPKFGSNVVNSDEYINKFDQIFSAYELSKAPLREFNLLLLLAKALAAGGQCIPTFSVFGFLLDRLGRNGLYNYQSMVYDVLPDFRYYETAFADSSRGNEYAFRKYFHFAHLIGSDPDMLASLIEYQIPRKNIITFKLLLQYFEPLAPSSPHSIPSLPSFMRSHFANSVEAFDMNQEVLIDLDTVGRALNGCVQLREYSALDTILNKLFLNLMQTNDGVRVVLNSIKDESALLCKSIPSLAPSVLFTENILLLLAQAYTDIRDSRRSKWLIPHIDAYLRTHESEKLASFLPLLRALIVSTSIKNASETNAVKNRKTIPISLSKDYDLKSQLTVSVMA